MTSLILTNPSHISKKEDKIRVSEVLFPSREKKVTLHQPRNISTIYIYKHSSFTSDVLTLLNKTPIYFIDGNKINNFIVNCYFSNELFKNDIIISKLQKSKRLKIAFTICRGVCYGRIKNLKRLNENRQNKKVRRYIISMQELVGKIKSCKTIEQLKAIEGNITNYFFKSFSIYYQTFVSRDRKSKDTLNILMNYTHSLIRSKVYLALLNSNINPHHGFYHYQDKKNKPFLSWDFAEFWIPYIDKLCLYALERGIIKETKQGKLSKSDRRNIIKLLENRIQEKEIKTKIGGFKNYILDGSRWSWV